MTTQINLNELLASTDAKGITKITDSIFDIKGEVIEVLKREFG